MPPNSSLSDKPICVSDSFHFSSFYWKESSASLANLGGGEDDSPPTNRNDEDDSIAGLNTPLDVDLEVFPWVVIWMMFLRLQ